MEKIFTFLQFANESSTPKLSENAVVKLEFTDSKGTHTTECQLVEFGWGLNRERIFHRFKIIGTDSKRYPVGAEFDLHMDFNGKENTFLFYPYYNDRLPSIRRMVEKTYDAYIRII